MRGSLRSLAIWDLACLLLALVLGWGKPAPVVGMFLVSGMAVGSLYALGGIGLVVLYRATGVLNLAAGAIGMAGVLVVWQLCSGACSRRSAGRSDWRSRSPWRWGMAGPSPPGWPGASPS